MKEIWVLGATGLSGRAIARELVASGADVVLTGRHAERLAEVAESVGEGARTRVVSGLGEMTALIPAEKPAVVVNTVGPFGKTARPMARASIDAGSHYLDLCNELGPTREVLELAADARGEGVTLVTGAGFGVLATEALVLEVRADRPPAAREMAAARPAVHGCGTAVLASFIDAIGYGGRRYRDGQLIRARLGAQHER